MKRWERSGTDELDPVIPMSLQEYLQSDFQPDRDYINGASRERHRGERAHGQMMTIVGAELSNAARQDGFIPLMSVRMRIDEQTILVPDLCLAYRTNPREDIIVTPPKLCVEILDSQDSLDNIAERFAMFREMGVENLWAIDAERRLGYFANDYGVAQPEDDVLHIAGTAVEIKLADVFAELEESND